jgi:hypothetical protein
MRLFLKKKTPEGIEFGIIYGSIALLILAVGRFLPVLSWAPDCVFRGLTGIPCPTCGATRSVVHLSHGNFLSAFTMNPLITVLLIAATVYFVVSLVSAMFDLPRMSVFFTDSEKHIVRAGVAILLLVQWVYLVILF